MHDAHGSPPVSVSTQLQLIPSVQAHVDAARQFMEASDFYSAIEHLGEAIEVCANVSVAILLYIILYCVHVLTEQCM